MRLSAALLTMLLAACAGGTAPPTSTLAPPTPTVENSPTTGLATPRPTSSRAPPSGLLVFEIHPEGTTARFRIEERLRNRPNTVVGETDRVSGRIQVDLAVSDRAQIGPITIEAGSFVTDDELRDSSIRGLILETSVYPTIVFAPASIRSLPPTAAPGDRLAFEVAGELTIRDFTRPIVFQVRLTAESFDRLRGEAEAVLNRTDFGLTIPSVPNVAEVAEEVRLELVFTAVRVP